MSLIWIGPRESDLLYSNLKFDYTITYSGTDIGGNTSLAAQLGQRINTNHNDSKVNTSNFLKKNIFPHLDRPDARFMFYNPSLSYTLGDEVVERTLCRTKQSILRLLRNKSHMRAIAQECILTIPYISFRGNNMPQFTFDGWDSNDIILQKAISSGGYGTQRFTIEQCSQFLAKQSEENSYIISPFLENAVPINVHLVIFNEDIIVFPPSYQVIHNSKRTFTYAGSDFNTKFRKFLYDKILQQSEILAQRLQELDYRGVCGIDYMVTQDEVIFLEINARFQASTFLLNKLLKKEGRASVHELNLLAFCGAKAPFQSFSKFQEPESFFTLMGNKVPTWYSELAEKKNSLYDVVSDGFNPEKDILNPEAYLFRVISKRNLCWLDEDFALRVAPNVRSDTIELSNKIMQRSYLHIKIALLNQGVRLSDNARRNMEKHGIIRKGVFQSVDLTLPNGMVINAPYSTDFSILSPYYIDWKENTYVLCYKDEFLIPIEFDTIDIHQSYTATNGTVARNVAFWATDRLRLHHQFRCRFKEMGLSCKFCNTKLKEGHYFIDDVCEVFDYYLENTVFRHILIGGGSGDDDTEPSRIIELAKHIRSRTDKEIYAMCLPPKDTSILKHYYDAGVNQIGFNIEVYNRIIAAELMPGKGNLSLKRYEDAFQEAVRLWDRNGSVRSMLILGLEPLDSFYEGLEWLCALGVMPIISVFRPVDKTELPHVLPLSNEKLEEIYLQSQKITQQHNLYLGPKCTACQNNTLSMPLID